MKKKVYNYSGGIMEVNDLKGLYIAHRGIHNNKIIENTIPAFSLALDKKVPIELDIRILKDGNIVVYHDENLKKLMSIDRDLSDCFYNDLKKLTFPNTDIHIPLLEDVLRLVSGKVLLVIEIKYSNDYPYKEYCKKIISILDNYSGDFVVKSFDIRIIYWFLKNTDYVTGLLLADVKHSLYSYFTKLKLTRSILKPDFLSVDYYLLENSLIQKFRKNNPVLVWTIRDFDTLDMVKDKADSFLIENFYF